MSKTGKSALTRERGRSGIIFGAPALIFVILFLGIPILQALYYSMTKWNGLSATWIGPNTFINELKNPIFWRVMQNNALLLAAVPVAILIPMGIAYLLNEKVAGWKFFRSIYFLPTEIGRAHV